MEGPAGRGRSGAGRGPPLPSGSGQPSWGPSPSNADCFPGLTLGPVCTHVHTHAHRCQCTNAHMHVHTCSCSTRVLCTAHMHTCAHVHACTYIHIHMHTCARMLVRCTHVHAHAHTHNVCMCVQGTYVHTCACVHIHIHVRNACTHAHAAHVRVLMNAVCARVQTHVYTHMCAHTCTRVLDVFVEASLLLRRLEQCQHWAGSAACGPRPQSPSPPITSRAHTPGKGPHTYFPPSFWLHFTQRPDRAARGGGAAGPAARDR